MQYSICKVTSAKVIIGVQWSKSTVFASKMQLVKWKYEVAHNGKY